MTNTFWHPSFRDPDGCTVVLKNRVLRFINDKAAQTLYEFESTASGRHLLAGGDILPWRIFDQSGLAALTVEEGIPPNLLEHSCDTVVEHERIAFPSFPQEWPPNMLGAAGGVILRIQSEILRDGFWLKDATPYNVLFDGFKPVHVDALSLERRPSGDALWRAEAQFIRTVILPLLAYRFLRLPPHRFFLDKRDGLTPEELYAWIGPLRRLSPSFFGSVTLPVWLSSAAERSDSQLYKRNSVSSDRATFTLEMEARRLSRRLKGLSSDLEYQSAWSGYDTDHSYSQNGLKKKELFVKEALKFEATSSVLDLGCNTGRYSVLAAQTGAKVVAVDSDLVVIDQLYSTARRENLDLLPLIVDLARPTPAVGWRNSEAPSFLDRAAKGFDIVIALAFLHHLMVTERIPLVEVFKVLAELTRRFAIVEYVDPSDAMFRRLCRGREELYSDFNEETFQKACVERFDIVDKVEVTEGMRSVYLLAVK